MRRGWSVLRAVIAAGAIAAPWLLCGGQALAAERSCTETLVPMSDGVRLHAWVSRPAPGERRPVLFMMDSYARSGRLGAGPEYDNACPEFLPDDYVPAYLSKEVTDRFALVQVSYRGTGASEGAFDMTGPRTQQDVAEALDWAAGGGWSTGAVTVVGESGTAFAGHHTLRHPSVRAALLFTSCADMYRCFYRGGQYNGLADVYMTATTAGYAGALSARNALGAMANPDPLRQQAALAEGSARAKAGAVNDAWWQERSALASLAGVTKPVMLTTDLYDIVQPFDALQLLPNARLNLGMGHLSAGVVAAGGERFGDRVRSRVDRFVSHYGLGDANGAERDPRITLATNTGGPAAFHAGKVLVRGEDRWPLRGTKWTRLRLGAGPSGSARSLNDGTLSTERSDGVPPGGAAGVDAAPLVPVPAVDMRTTAFVRGGEAPADLRDDERTALTYTTPEFTRDVEISGPITLRLFATATAPDFDWAVRITDVHPDERSEWITDGSLRASLRRVDGARSLRAGAQVVRAWHTFDTPEPVPVGQPVEYLIDVIATSNVFRAGHRLRLDLVPAAAADSPRTGGAGAVTVLRDAAHPSTLTVPLIPRRCGRSAPLVAGVEQVRGCAKSFAEAVAPAKRAGA